MRGWVRLGLIATMALATVGGCDENEGPAPEEEMLGGGRVPSIGSDAGSPAHEHGDPPEHADRDDDWLDDDWADDDTDDDWQDDDWQDDDWQDDDWQDDDWQDDDWQDDDADSGTDDGALGDVPGNDAGLPPSVPTPSLPQVPPAQNDSPRTAVPAELVGIWEHGTIDFELWENYKPEYWAGRNAIPTREAMIFNADGTAKFYRYEGLFKFYEELIDCEGTVTFNANGTFTFHPVRGHKRFYDNSQRILQTDRALTEQELADSKLAGTRGYRYLPTNEPPAIEITVPSSAPYKWYRKQ